MLDFQHQTVDPLVGGAASLGVEFRHLRAFVALAEELHFTRAAQRLFVAQQALSTQIRQLETMMGTKLFDRTTRRVELTDAGRALYASAPEILRLIDDSWASALSAAGPPAAQVRIAYELGINDVRDTIELLHDRSPGITVKAWQTSVAIALSDVRRGDADVALLREPPTDPTLEVRMLAEEPFLVTLAADHPLAANEVIHCDDLRQLRLTFWAREVCTCPGLYEGVERAFAVNLERGLVHRYENTTRRGFLDDPIAREEIAAGRAFAVRMVARQDETPDGYVNRILEPTVHARLYLAHKAQVAGAFDEHRDAMIELVAEAARDVADDQSRVAWAVS